MGISNSPDATEIIAGSPMYLEKKNNDALTFFTQFIRYPGKTGSVIPSSTHLAKALIPSDRLESAKVIVELGPGSGVVTKQINAMIPPKTQYIGIDINSLFVDLLKNRYPNLDFVCNSASNISRIISKYGYNKIDIVICSLPLKIMSKSFSVDLLNELDCSLDKGSIFTYFSYVHSIMLSPYSLFDRSIKRSMELTQRKLIVKNFPPAVAWQYQK